jgi:hypothetical protein
VEFPALRVRVATLLRVAKVFVLLGMTERNRFVWLFQFFDTVPEDDDPLFWSRHIESTLNLRSLLSVRQPNHTTLLILHLLSPRRITSDLASMFSGLLLRQFMPLVGKHPAEFDLALQALLQGRSRGIYIFRNGVSWVSQCTGLPESGWNPRDVTTSANNNGNRASTSEDPIGRKVKKTSRKESTAERIEVLDAVPSRFAHAENGSDAVHESSTDDTTVQMVKKALEAPHQPDAIVEDQIGTVVKEVTNMNCDLKVPTLPCIPQGKSEACQQDLWPLILGIIGRDPKLPTRVGLNPERFVNHERNTKASNFSLRSKSTSERFKSKSESVKKYPQSHAANTSQAYTIRSSSRGVLCRNRGGHLMRVVKILSQSDDNVTTAEGARQVERQWTENMHESIKIDPQGVFGRPYRRSGAGAIPTIILLPQISFCPCSLLPCSLLL